MLLEVPNAPPSENDDIAVMMFRMMLLATEGVEVCTRSEGDRQNGYIVRHFLPDGTSLPQLDEPGRMTIVPAAPIDQLIRRHSGARTRG
jgi:hypothetical protein